VRPPLAATVGAVGSDAAATTETPRHQLDEESRRWLHDLRSTGAARDDAVLRLHALLLRAARHEVRRRAPGAWHIGASERDDLAHQSADDALVALLGKLDDYRGASRFTTWAYKFALLEAAVKLRRRAWQGREIPLAPETWELFGGSSSPQQGLEQSELLDAVREGIATALTAHQRDVLVALAINGVPIDVLAERLGSTRGALYKTLHDARKKLREEIEGKGLSI